MSKTFYSRFFRFKEYAKTHKIISFVSLILVISLGYWGYKYFWGTTQETRYVMASVIRGTIITSVTGSGQVSVSNQVDLKPRVSGDIVYLGIMNGQHLRSGELIMQLDVRDAQKVVRDATVNLESAKLSLEKLLKSADELTIIQSENTLARAKESKIKTQDSLEKAYDDGFNDVSNAFLDLPTVMAGLHDILYSSNAGLGGTNQWNIDFYAAAGQYDSRANPFKIDAGEKYKLARETYDKNFQDYKLMSRFSGKNVIEASIEQTYNTTKSIAEAVKSTNNLIQFYEDKLVERNLKPAALADTHLSSLNSYTLKTNSHLGNLLTAKNDIKNSQDSIINAERTIIEDTKSLDKLKADPDELDLRSARIAVSQKENLLADAQENLKNYFVRAPFDAVVAKVSVKQSDSINSGSAVATLISKQKTAEVSLNEIDAAKIKIGQKATITFDAVPNLSISGEVFDVDILGTVSQGVVTYNVKIKFDTQDDRVKPGMSLSTAIITDVKQDVLSIPNSAVKLKGNRHYVEVFGQKMSEDSGNQGVVSSILPTEQDVEVGLSNDMSVEIISGLKENDQVVTRTILPSTNGTVQQAPSLFGAAGGNRGAGGGGGGVMRVLR